MSYRHGSSDRVSALQVQNPEFKLQSHKKKKNQRNLKKKKIPNDSPQVLRKTGISQTQKQ
jgi:hypothetical protein